MSAFDDYLNASPQQAQGQSFDAYLGNTTPAPVSKPSTPIPSKTTSQSPSAWDQTARQLGLTARAAGTGVTSLPAMIGDALNSGVNLGIRGINNVAGTHIPQLGSVSGSVQDLMNSAGLPQPQNDTERVVQNIASSMAGVSPTMTAGKVLAGATGPVTSAVGRTLQALPGM